MKHGKPLVALAGLVFLFGAGLVSDPSRPSNARPLPRSGQETVVVFIASSTCAGIADERLPDALRDIRLGLSDAQIGSSSIVNVGISVDADHETGIELLSRFGPFDEIHAGRWYLNAAAQKYLVDIPGLMAIPQLVVLVREVTVRGGIMKVDTVKIVSRRIGASAIVLYADALRKAPSHPIR